MLWVLTVSRIRVRVVNNLLRRKYLKIYTINCINVFFTLYFIPLDVKLRSRDVMTELTTLNTITGAE